MDWGLIEMVSQLRADPNTKIFHWGWAGDNVFWKQFVGGAFIALVMTGLDQDMMQKNLSIDNTKAAQRNIYLQMVLFIVVNIVFLSLGALLFQYAGAQEITVERSDELFQTIALEHAKPYIAVVFLLGVVAAAYSSADSALTALTTSFCVDFLGFERSRKTHIGTRRLVHAGFAILLFFVIILFENYVDEAVISGLFKAAGFTYGPLLGLFAFGILSKRSAKDQLVLAISLVSIGLTYCYYSYFPKWLLTYQIAYKAGFELIVINGLITYVCLYLSSSKTST